MLVMFVWVNLFVLVMFALVNPILLVMFVQVNLFIPVISIQGNLSQWNVGKNFYHQFFFLSALFWEFSLLGTFINNNFYLIPNNEYISNNTSIVYSAPDAVYYNNNSFLQTILKSLIIFVYFNHCIFLNALVWRH